MSFCRIRWLPSLLYSRRDDRHIIIKDVIHDFALHSSGRQLAILLIFSNLVLFRHLLAQFAWVLLTQVEEFLHYSSQPLFLFSWILVRLRHEMLLRRSPTVNPIQSFQRLDFFAHLRSTVEPLRSLSVCNRCCTSASSSHCMSSSMRVLHSSECGFVTLCAPAARVVQTSHSGVGPYRATSCFRMYPRFCCGVLTIASGHYCRRLRWSHFRLFSDEHPRNSSTLSDEFIVPLLACSFPLNSRTSQQSTF